MRDRTCLLVFFTLLFTGAGASASDPAATRAALGCLIPASLVLGGALSYAFADSVTKILDRKVKLAATLLIPLTGLAFLMLWGILGDPLSVLFGS